MSSTLLTLSALFTLALSAVVPTAPAPGAVFKAGGECSIQWTPDPTGTWKQMTIQLMTGQNLNMTVLETVAVVDGTTLSNFTWPCPEVDPPAPICFYQFSINNDPTTDLWTGRFTIAKQDGTTVPAPNATQDGQSTPWGQATVIQNFSTEISGTTPATSLPPTVANATTTTTSGSASATSSGSTALKTTTLVSSSSASSSASTPSGTSNSESSKSNGAEKLVAGGVIGFVAAVLALV